MDKMTLINRAKEKMNDVVGRRKKTLCKKFASGEKNFLRFDKYKRLGAYHWENPNLYYRAQQDTIRELVPEGSVCVDLGCGDAAYFKVLSRTARKLIGIDGDSDAIFVARKKLKENNIRNAICYNMYFSSVNRKSIKLPDGADFVFSMDTIEHLPDPKELLRVCFEIVSPTGTVVIGTPLFIRDEVVSRYHVKEFTFEQLSSICEKRFSVRDVRFLPLKRKDGNVYQNNYCVVILKPKKKVIMKWMKRYLSIRTINKS